MFDEVERDSAQEWLAAIEGTRSRRNRQVRHRHGQGTGTGRHMMDDRTPLDIR